MRGKKRVWNKTLIDIAKHSPLDYARRIRIRNCVLLKKLRLLKPYLDTDIIVPDKVRSAVKLNTSYGCPHCNKCICAGSCLWLQHFKPVEWACMHVRFPSNICLDDLFTSSLGISYGSDSEFIRLDCTVSKHDYDVCEAFLLDHIAWTKLDVWGSELCC